MLNERDLTQKSTSCMIPFYEVLELAKLNYDDRSLISCCLRKECGLTRNMHKGTFQGGGNILSLDMYLTKLD